MYKDSRGGFTWVYIRSNLAGSYSSYSFSCLGYSKLTCTVAQAMCLKVGLMFSGIKV